MSDRREFIKSAALGAVALTAAGCDRAPAADSANAAAASKSAGVRPFELDEMTLDQLQASMVARDRTARSLTERYLSRIEELDRRGPELRAVIETNPDALQIAEQLDAERRAGKVRGPLHGIPVLLKDNIDTHDRMTTTAGSLALEGSIPPRDSFVAARLRAAGAVLLGKANLSEWANFRGSSSTSGWSARGGQCRNPYALERSPSGSSSGSAVAVAANLAPVAIGTETDGSITAPSTNCGIVGIKPTVGLWSRSGIIPISHSQDTAGPMTRTVRDAAILLGVIAVDGADTATAASQGHAQSDYTKFLDRAGLRGMRIGVARNFSGFKKNVLAVFDEAVAALKNAGAIVIDPVDVPQMNDAGWNAEAIVLEYEFKDGIAKYLANAAHPRLRTLRDLIAFNETNAQTELAFFGQETFLSAEKRGPLTDKVYLDALRRNHRHTRGNGIDAVLKKHNVEVLVAPTMGVACMIDHVLGDRFDSGYSVAQSAIAGYPHITVPMGFVFGLPVGLSFFAGAWSEPTLLRAAYAFEQATDVRKAPDFRVTAV
jgi:amidase